MAKVNHIYAAYLHLKIKIDKIFLNALNTQFLGKIQNTWTQIDALIIFLSVKPLFFQFYYDISNKNTTFAYVETLNKQLWKIKT